MFQNCSNKTLNNKQKNKKNAKKASNKMMKT